MKQPSRILQSQLFRTCLALVVLGTLTVGIVRLTSGPPFEKLRVSLATGVEGGGYFSLGQRLAEVAARGGGTITVLPSDGSIDNLQRLADGKSSCAVHFGLVQAGISPNEADKNKLTLIGKLPRSESVFFLGKVVERFTTFESLRGKKIGIGPAGSGTAKIGRELFALADLGSLGVVLDQDQIPNQIERAKRGELDLTMLVVDEDAKLVSDAVTSGLEIAPIGSWDVIARRFPHLRTGRIGAGQFDAVRMLPATDRKVLRVDTLVLGNGCAKRSQLLSLMMVLAETYPDFIALNREAGNKSGYPLHEAAKSYFEHQGLQWSDEYLTWFVDLMSTGTWVNIFLTFSILFNIMNFGNRFRLYRIDQLRFAAEREIANVFGPTATLGDITRCEPSGDLLRDDVGVRVDAAIQKLAELAEKSRKASVDLVSPMGQEMTYRFHEHLMQETIAALRAFQVRWNSAREQSAL